MHTDRQAKSSIPLRLLAVNNFLLTPPTAWVIFARIATTN